MNCYPGLEISGPVAVLRVVVEIKYNSSVRVFNDLWQLQQISQYLPGCDFVPSKPLD